MQHDGDEDFHLARTVKTTLRNVPQRCREVWSRCADVAARAQRDADEDERIRGDVLFLILPRLLLTPVVGAGSHWSSKAAKVVKQRCLRFLAGGSEWEALWTETTTSQPDPPSAQTAADRDEVQRQRRAEYEQDSERTELQHKHDYVVKLVQGGDVRKAASHLTSLGTAPDTADTAAKIGALQFDHPVMGNQLPRAGAKFGQRVGLKAKFCQTFNRAELRFGQWG